MLHSIAGPADAFLIVYIQWKYKVEPYTKASPGSGYGKLQIIGY